MSPLKLLCLFITFNHAQVVPHYQPYSHIYPEINLPSSLLVLESNDINLDFRENAQMSILPDGLIFRLTLQFDSIKSGHLSITDWQVPENSRLFIFNNNISYTGPYLSDSNEEFIFSEADTIQRFIKDLIQIHPILKGKTFQVVQNNQIKREGALIRKAVIDLLPQFSGG